MIDLSSNLLLSPTVDPTSRMHLTAAWRAFTKPPLEILIILTTAAGPISAATLINFAGSGEPGCTGDGGPALQAKLDNPFGLVRGPDKALWFADYEAHVVRRIAANGTITTVVGNGRAEYAGDGGPARGGSFRPPHELRFDRAGNLFICDTGNHVIRRYDPKTRVLTTFAGTGKEGYSGDGGPAS